MPNPPDIQASSRESTGQRPGGRITAGIAAMILIGLCLRLWAFPHYDETRNVDEPGYLKGSLTLLEGLPPGYKAAPAGPNTWVGWLYAGGVAAVHLVHPDAEERRLPLAIRPFFAVNHALFDQYRDLRALHELWIVSQLILALSAIAAGWRFGYRRAGIAGALLVSGLLAVAPLFVEFTEMSRPYMTAWCFGVIALYYAAVRQGRARQWGSAVFLGLAIASRIEMLLFVPMVLWEFWYRREPCKLRRVLAGVIGITLATTLVAAPWLTTHLLGNLRTILTVRLGPTVSHSVAPRDILKLIAWQQGMAPALLMFPLVLLWMRSPDRNRLIVLAVYIFCLFLSMLRGTVFLQQQGPQILAIIVFGATAMRPLAIWRPQLSSWVVALLLTLPLFQAARTIVAIRREYSPDLATAWIDAHIPPGTRVYIDGGRGSLLDPLPTPAAANALWREVTDESAGRRKFESGLARFHLKTTEIPPALSEENLVQERGNRREFVILGSRPDYPEARFDIQIFNGSPVFGVQDIAAAFAASGGVVIWGGPSAPAEFGAPVAQWTNAGGWGTFIYCSPDVARHLIGQP